MRGVSHWISQNGSNISLTLLSVVIGVLVSWYFFRRQKEPKTLDYAIISRQPIGVGADQDLPPNLKVTWEEIWPPDDSEDADPDRVIGRSISKDPDPNRVIGRSILLISPRIVRIHIRNTGKKDIEDDDFKEPIRVRVTKGVIIDAAVTGASHPGIYTLGTLNSPRRERLGPREMERSFVPTLLNECDWIELQIITEQSEADPEVTCWIKGQSRPTKLRPDLLDTPLRETIAKRLRLTDPTTRAAAIITCAWILAGLFMAVALLIRR